MIVGLTPFPAVYYVVVEWRLASTTLAQLASQFRVIACIPTTCISLSGSTSPANIRLYSPAATVRGGRDSCDSATCACGRLECGSYVLPGSV